MAVRDRIESIIDEFRAVQSARASNGWDKYWLDCLKYALPADISDETFYSSSIGHLTGMLGQPLATRKTRDVYDQTSMWAVERLSAGLQTLKTPETTHWHGLTMDDPFGVEPTDADELWFEKVTNYMFKVRNNPRSGFWPTHKGAVRSTCALGDGFFFVEEVFGQPVPWTYEFVPLGQCFPVKDSKGRMVGFFRLRNLAAHQIASRWPDGNVPGKIMADANDPSRKHITYPILHAVVERMPGERQGQLGTRAAPFAGAFISLDHKQLISESGFWEMPYIQHGWSHLSGRAYSEGPMALALAEVKSLNDMAKNELVSSQQAVRPPLAAYGDNFTRINLNPGKVNPGLVSGDGRLLVQPIMTHTRPDFAQAVLERRTNTVRELLYLNLWQILIERPDMTATEALLRAQEKGDLLGPVGLSFNYSLAMMTERELGIMGRKMMFEEGEPLAAPDSIGDTEIGPVFTSPLDRMRSMDEVVGAQRTVQGMLEVAAFDPSIMKKLDAVEYADILRKGFGGPARMFIPEEDMPEPGGNPEEQMAQLQQLLATVQQGGQAAQAVGNGVQALQQTPGMMGGPAPAAAEAVAA